MSGGGATPANRSVSRRKARPPSATHRCWQDGQSNQTMSVMTSSMVPTGCLQFGQSVGPGSWSCIGVPVLFSDDAPQLACGVVQLCGLHRIVRADQFGFVQDVQQHALENLVA